MAEVLHNGPRLLVPVRLEAMVVDYALRRLENGQWARSRAAYNELVKRFGPAFPRQNAVRNSEFQSTPPADDGDGVPDLGIHLHWKMPKGLRHGQQEDQTGELDFPDVPNRWVIVRLWIDEEEQLQLKYWIVQSDLIQRPTALGTGFLVKDSTSGKLGWKLIGKVHELAADAPWPVVEGDAVSLKVVGMEDSTFSTYNSHNANVFSMVDPLEDLQAILDDTSNSRDHFELSYLVAGWYDEPTKDPLHQAAEAFEPSILQEYLERLGMTIDGEMGLMGAQADFKKWSKDKSAALSPLMLCHAALHSVQWYGHKNDDEAKSNSGSGKPIINRSDSQTIPGIVLANSSMDALICFIKNKLEKNGLSKEKVALAGELIQAYQNDILDDYTKVGGQGLLNRNLHKNCFDAESGGTEWAVVRNREPETEAEQQMMQQIYDAAMPKLKLLNEACLKINRLRALQESQQLELFTCLFAVKKTGRQKKDVSAQWQEKTKYLKDSLKKIQLSIDTIDKNEIEPNKGSIYQILGIDPQEKDQSTDFSLRERLLPPYWVPSDPVLLIHAARTSAKQTDGETLHCRYTGQTIRSLTLHNSSDKLSVEIPPIPHAEQLPKELKLLLEEFILLNPNHASWLSTEDTDKLSVQQTMIWNSEKYEGLDAQRLTQQAGFEGLRPAFNAFRTYTPPWSPLFLDWMVYFFQEDGRQLAKDTKASNWIKNWNLTDGTMDFEWNKDIDPPPIDRDAVEPYFWIESGRSLITSHMPDILKARLLSLKEETLNPLQQTVVNAVISLLDGFDIITQRLNGLNDLWLQYDISNPMPPELLVDNRSNIDLQGLKEIARGIPQGKGALNRFFPLRSGFLLPHFVRITDNFGIALYPNRPYDPLQLFIPSDSEKIPKGRGMDNPAIKGTRMAQLPPRLLQPARLQMEWVDGTVERKAAPISQAEQDSPIAGWLIPNHLDKSLMVFDENGSLQVSLMLVERNGSSYVRKESSPYRDPASVISNYFLRELVDQLLSFDEDSGEIFSAFLSSIDSTTWVTDPLGSREKKGLSALIGRPLALVRARVSMELKGTAVRRFDVDQPVQYQVEKSSNPFGLMQLPLPFYVGADNLPNNGLIGYFDNADFSKFYVVTDHLERQNEFIEGRENLLVTLNDDGMSEDQKDFRYLSMLVDYRGVVHTVSGLLPTFELGLTKELVGDALANMQVTFRVGPMMVDPDQLRMPKPGDIQGKLSWIYQSGIQIWKDDQALNEDAQSWENTSIDQANETAAFPHKKRNQLTEGWLKLSDALKDKGNQK